MLEVGHGDMIHGAAEDPVAEYHGMIHSESFGVGLPKARGAEDEAVVQPVARQGQGVQFVFAGRGLLDAHPEAASLRRADGRAGQHA